MTKFKAFLIFLVFSTFSLAQTPVLNRSWDLKAVTTTNQCSDDATKTCSPPENIAGRGLSAHVFTWSVQSGVMTSCTLSFQTSPNNSSTSTWTTQTTGDCTSSGTSTYLTFTANFIRVKITPTLQSGTQLVTVNYAGYVIPPTTIATITTAPLNNQNVNTVRYSANFTGATGGAKIAAAWADLPSTGGMVIANAETAQTITSTITLNKPGILMLDGVWNASVAVPFVSSVAGVTISGYGTTATILNIASGIDGINPVTGTHITNFTIRGPGSASVGNSCIDSGSAIDVVIDYMAIENCGDHGINTGGSSSNWLITKNHFLNQINNHILVGTGSTKIHIVDNIFNTTLTSTGNNCVDLNGSFNVVSENTMLNCGREGGAIDDWAVLIQAVAGSNADGNLIHHNQISGCGAQCIIVRAAASQTANGNTIDHNYITTAGQKTAGSGTGIQIDGTSNGTLAGEIIDANQIWLCLQHGILADGTSTGIIQGLLVTSNIATGNTGTGLYVTGSNAISPKLDNNLMSGNGTNLNTSGAIRPVITNNTINFTAFGYSFGPDTAGGNLICLQNKTAGTYGWCLDSSGNLGIGTSSPGVVLDVTGAGRVSTDFTISTGTLTYGGKLFAALGTPSNGTFVYCADCTIANPCAGAGGGAFAKRLGGVWVCN